MPVRSYWCPSTARSPVASRVGGNGMRDRGQRPLPHDLPLPQLGYAGLVVANRAQDLVGVLAEAG